MVVQLHSAIFVHEMLAVNNRYQNKSTNDTKKKNKCAMNTKPDAEPVITATPPIISFNMLDDELKLFARAPSKPVGLSVFIVYKLEQVQDSRGGKNKNTKKMRKFLC